MIRKKIAIALVVLSFAAMAAGILRKEGKHIYVNAMTICYSCIGLE